MCSPKMSELVKYRGPGFAKMTLINLVAELNFLLSSDNGLNKIQLEAAGKLVLSDYYFFSVSDFKLCFKNGLKGKYGKIFGKLSIPVIFEWLREFHVEWLAESQRLANNERLKPVKPVDNPIKPEQAKAIIEAVNSVPAKAKIEYKSLEHYCEFTGKNYHEFAKEFAHQVQDEYKKYLEYFNSKTDTNNEKLCILEYRNYKEKSLLNSLNKKDKSALRNDALKEYSKKIFELKTQGL